MYNEGQISHWFGRQLKMLKRKINLEGILMLAVLLFSCWVMSDSLRPQGLQHARLPCPSPSPKACSNSYPLSQRWHPIISSSVTLFSFYPQSFLPSGSFPMRWPKCWSFSFSFSNEFSELISLRIDCFDLFAAQGTLKSLLQHHSWKASVLWYSVFFMVQLLHPHMTAGKTIALTRQTFVSKVMSLFFNI